MILIILEDGHKVVVDSMTDELKAQWNDGLIDIVSFMNGKFMEWDGNEETWVEVKPE